MLLSRLARSLPVRSITQVSMTSHANTRLVVPSSIAGHPSHWGIFCRTMFIQTHSTPNPNTMKFTPGTKVLESGTMDFTDFATAQRSPLARSLFRIDGVKAVMLASNFISVSKAENVDWAVLKPEIWSSMTDFFNSGLPVLNEDVSAGSNAHPDTIIQPEDSETVAMIKELIETRIRPFVQEDGGDLKFVAFENGVVKVELQGACSTCPSSTVTLKNGIENMMMHYVPEVQSVIQVESDLEKISKEQLQKTEQKLEETIRVRLPGSHSHDDSCQDHSHSHSH